MNKLRIWWLKRRLRKAIYRWNDRYAFYQCGNALMDEITGGKFSRDIAHIEMLKDRLREIDPNFPRSA